MRFYCHEVVQRWISPDGKVTDLALLRGFLFCYCDVWALGSDMEVRPHNSLYDDVAVSYTHLVKKTSVGQFGKYQRVAFQFGTCQW